MPVSTAVSDDGECHANDGPNWAAERIPRTVAVTDFGIAKAISASCTLSGGAIHAVASVALAILCVTPSGAARAQNPPAAITTPVAPGVAAGLAAMRGFVVDSLHQQPLAGATVSIEGTSRTALTSREGRYLVDSIPPGSHRVLLAHPVLDTIGMRLASRALSFAAGELKTIDLAIPTSGKLVSLLCPASVLQNRGPGALTGFVRDPETKEPATGSKVQLVYEIHDLMGGKAIPMVREAIVDSTGAYRICGLPTPMTGKVQVFRNGISSGEVATAIEQGSLGLRSLSIAAVHIATVSGESGAPAKRAYRGTARVTGVVVDKQGRPIADARVTVQGSGITAVSLGTGDFELDSLPSGTQSLEVRKLGYSATDQAVELASAAPATVRVVMSEYVPILKTVRVEASLDKGLSDVGYLKRKQAGLGYFMDGINLRKDALTVTDAMRSAPGLKIVPSSDGSSYTIKSSRGGCVTLVVDGTQWKELTPGDLDSYVPPSDLRAVEVYSASMVPAEFQTPGQSNCTTVVIWTALSTNRNPKK